MELNIEDYEEQLKPCPFCGATPIMNDYPYGSGNYGSGSHIEIRCHHCDVRMVCGDTSYLSLENCQDELRRAVYKWNSRR